jgi:energy-coupling factor transport system substrate-specific component
VGRAGSGKRRFPVTYATALIPAAVALNVVGSIINGVLRLPLFLDMIGTAVVAITIGPWWGALAGALTNLVLGFIHSPISLPFAVSSVAGALVWGYGVRWGLGRGFVRYFFLSLLVAVAVTLTAVPIYVLVFGGATGHFSDMISAAFLGMGEQLAVAVLSSNLIVSVADKVVSSFLALAVIESLPPALTDHLELAKAPRMQLILWITGTVVLSLAAVLVFAALRS